MKPLSSQIIPIGYSPILTYLHDSALINSQLKNRIKKISEFSKFSISRIDGYNLIILNRRLIFTRHVINIIDGN